MKKEKPNYLFRALAILAPNYAMNIMRARYMERVYSGALNYPSDDWQSANTNDSANKEIQLAQKTLISRSRDLSRNNPYAKKATDVIVSNTVGYGIMATIKHKNKRKQKEIEAEWKRITESNLCDNELRNNFTSLQTLAMRTIVDSGEVIAIKYLDVDSPKIQLLEPDFIDDSLSGIIDGKTDNYISGIKVDNRNRRISYKIYEKHPGDMYGSTKSKEISADKVIHSFFTTRPGQLRGVPWCHAVIQTLKDFDDFQYATIIRQKISACLVGVITTTGADNLLGRDKVQAKRKAETKMTPGSFKYADPGEDVKFSSPPPAQGYSDFVAETIRAVACGYGITYESISNDYSRVNYSSGRMGKIEMKNNIEQWRWNMFIPQFCDGYMDMFKEFCVVKGLVKTKEEIEHEWVAPAYTSIDPNKEINADKEAVLAGFKSKSMVIREQGLDPELVREEIKKEREADKAAGLTFDVYGEVPKEEPVPSEDDTEETDLPSDEERYFTGPDDKIFKLKKDGSFEEIKD